MALISKIEKDAFYDLFNRNGYVLDFTTPSFDTFTKNSIGIALCEKYQVSKGQSLCCFLSDADEKSAIKLLLDLFEYYEFHYGKEIDSNGDFSSLYKRCKPVAERLKSSCTLQTLDTSGLKKHFCSEYISNQIDMMVRLQSDNPTDAIGKSKELIESCCKTILEYSHVPVDKNWDMNKLVNETFKYLQITPNEISDTIRDSEAIKAILGNLKAIAGNIANLRNNYGSGHGKSSSFKGLQERHAKLAVGSSITLTNFLWDSFEKKHN